MIEWLALALILAAAWLLGRLALRFLLSWAGEYGVLHPLERHFAALSLGLTLGGWAALVLAEAGWFSLPVLGVAWLLAALALLIAARRNLFRRNWAPQNALPPEEKSGALFAGIGLPDWGEYVLLALWLPAATWLVFRPHETILGGADAGVYLSTAAHVAQSGQILVDDETLAQLDSGLYPALLRERRAGEGTPYYLFPGFNVVLDPPGRVIPDFLHLHPTWQAVAYAAGGVRAALLMPGLWALLGTFAVYLTLRRLSGWPAAMLALAGLSLNALQIWFGRYPVAESLTQYLLWTALWALGAWVSQRRPLPLWGLLAGLCLGLLFLTRIDTLFLMLVPALALLWLISRSRLRRRHAWFFLPVALLVAHTALHGYFISTPYFRRIGYYVANMLSVFWPALLLLAVLGIAAALLLAREDLQRWVARHRRTLLAPLVVAVLALAVYGWFVRPLVGATPSYREWYDGSNVVLTDRENLVRLGWYLSPLGVWLGVGGICLLLWNAGRKSVALLGLGLFFTLLYLWRIQATPHQVYAMRRYVPVTVPLFILATAYLLNWLAGRSRPGLRGLALLLIPLWLGWMGWSARGFVSQVDHSGLVSQLEDLDGQLADESVLIFDDQTLVSRGDVLGTPLHYLFGHDVYTLRRPQVLQAPLLVKTIQSWQNSGRSVYWVGPPEWLQQQGFLYNESDYTIRSSMLEGSFDHKPFRIVPVEWTLRLLQIEERQS